MEEKKEIQIELSAEVAEGIYSNLAIISHAPSEFVIDFIRLLSWLPAGKPDNRQETNSLELVIFSGVTRNN